MERSKQEGAASTADASQANLGAAPRPIKPGGKPLDRVDEAGIESFPASDPPAHWAGKDRPPLLNGEEIEAEEEDD